MIREKPFYRMFFGLALSLALQNLLTFSVNLMDTLMLARYHQDAMSGVSLCNQIQFLLQMIVEGGGEGVVILGSQYWGKNRLDPIPHIIGAALRVTLVFSVLLFAVISFAPAQILSLLSNDSAVIGQGVQYFRVIRFSYVIFTLTRVLVASLRSIGIVRLGQVISFSTLCINVTLNYLLIYGHAGFPELGVQGAAIATLISRCVELLIVLWYLKFREHRLNLTAKKLIFMDASYMTDFVRVASPGMFNQGLWGIAQMAQTGILGHLGGDVTAANAITVQVFQVLSVIAYGSASASGIVVGKTVGEGRMDALRPLVYTLEILFIVIGLCSGALIFFLRTPILYLFGRSLTDTARALSLQFLSVIALTTVGTSYQMACDTGIIRGGGDTSFSAKMNLISMWLIVIPFAALAAFRWNAPPVVVFFLLKWDQLYKIIPVTIRLHSWKWPRNVTRESA